jgi:hypothetical protein
MDFTNIHEAAKFVRELSEEETARIGDHEVWRQPDGSVVILEPGEGNNNEWLDEGAVLIGTVAEKLY